MIAIGCIIVFGWIWYVIFSKGWSGGTPTPVLSGENRYMGEKILVSGVMSPVATFTTYTHEFVSSDGEIFGLKSIDIDLYQYSGSVDIKWEITDFRRELPIVTVTEIVGSRQGTGVSGDLIDGNPDYYFFKEVGLGFDLSISDGYVVEQQAEDLLLIDMGGNQPETVLTISPFVCKAWDNLKDCQALQTKFTESGNETYVSTHNITFYNLTETKTRVAFNKGYGYYVTPTEENLFASFIDFMSYMSQERIQEAATKEISTLCKDINQTMTEVTSSEFSYQTNGIVVVTLRGFDANQQTVGCEIAVRLGNSLKVALVRFTPTAGGSVIQQDNPQLPTPPSQPTLPTGTTDTQAPLTGTVQQVPDFSDNEGVQPPAPQETPESYENRLSYTSVRGYIVYFSNKSISYAGQIIDTNDLGVDGLSCSYQLNVIQWSRADQIDTNPDLIMYECTGSPSASALASKNLVQVGSAGDLLFVVKHLSTNLIDMQIGIEDIPETQ